MVGVQTSLQSNSHPLFQAAPAILARASVCRNAFPYYRGTHPARPSPRGLTCPTELAPAFQQRPDGRNSPTPANAPAKTLAASGRKSPTQTPPPPGSWALWSWALWSWALWSWALWSWALWSWALWSWGLGLKQSRPEYRCRLLPCGSAGRTDQRSLP